MLRSRRHDRVAVDLGQHLHLLARVLDPRRADEDRPQRLVAQSAHGDVGLEAAHLAPEGVAARLDVHQPEVRAVEHDQARRTCPSTGRPPATKS